MIIGVECTAHTFGVGIVEKGKVLSNVRDMFKTETGGIIPTEAAKHHKLVSEKLWKDALNFAKVSEKDLTAIALSNAPGLAPCLLSGLEFAKNKSLELGIPIIPVNHCIAHLEIGKSVGAKDPVLLYTSGANTQIIAYASGKYRVFGETIDLGVGNFLDKLGRVFGLGFPGGPTIEKYSLNSKPENYIELPYSIKGMDVSFSGIYTKVMQLFKKGIDSGLDREKLISDLSFSVQETVFAMLIEAAERAMAHTGKKELVLGGGVGCNKRLREMCKIMCDERGAKFYCPDNSLMVDNGAMIAYTGELIYNSENFNSKKFDNNDLDIKPRERTDQVEISWL